MVDVEFVVQYLVLAHSATHEALRANTGNIALLQEAEAVGLLPPGMGRAAADAYRELRQRQHRARLDEASTQIDEATVACEAEAVRALWAHVLG
jgi:glutamate-ammonia-ligase adenylyltransferase